MSNSNEITALNILDNMLTAVILLNSKLEIIYSNFATEQIFGLGYRKLHNKKLNEVFEYTNFDFSRLQSCKSKEQGYTDLEVTFVVEATPIIVEVNVIPFVKGNDFQIILELRKIEQLKRMNYEKQQYEQHLAARDLIRGLAHEIKNPLGGLRGAAQLLQRQFNNHPDVKEYTTIIIEQADRLKVLVDRLLGPQKVHDFALTNIHEIIEKVRKLLSMDLPSNITIVRDYDPSIPELMLDADQMQQALINIVYNAILVLKENKCSDGIITIKTRTAFRVKFHDNTAKMALLIQITDNGPGIPPNIIDTIFYPLVTGRNGGVGLGLTITQQIINHHRGKIECNSWKGHTEFTIYIPLKE